MRKISDQQKKCREIVSVLCNNKIHKHEKEGNALDVLVATILSQNTNDRLSYEAYSSLKSVFPDWSLILNAPSAKIEKLIKIGGLAKQKSSVIKSLIKYLNETYGKVDLDYLSNKTDEEIFIEFQALKGIGNKTISCLLLFGLDRKSFPVDTHIHRICNRTGIVKTKNADDTYKEMKNLVPKGKEYCFHVGLIKFGRDVCKARIPECYNCKIVDYCDLENKNMVRPRVDKAVKKENIFILNKI